MWAPIPDRIDATLTSPVGTVLQARAWIDQVVVDWGDTTSSPLVLNESQLGRFWPYPDGSAFHVYETKTCNDAGPEPVFRGSGRLSVDGLVPLAGGLPGGSQSVDRYRTGRALRHLGIPGRRDRRQDRNHRLTQALPSRRVAITTATGT